MCPVTRNATYISPKIENKIINIIAYNVLQKNLIDEIKTAKFFTIRVNKVERHHVKQLPLCIRFVDDKKNMREEFLEFRECTRVTDEAIANQIIQIIEKTGLDIKDFLDTMEQAIYHQRL